MLKKTMLALFLAICAMVPFTAARGEGGAPINEEGQLARVNWNINIGGGWCGCYPPPYYYPPCPYGYYPYPPPYACPYPPCYGGGIYLW
jgi:hypothetical protein